MKMKSMKALFAASALLLTAGSVFAQPTHVSGTFAMTTYTGSPATTTAWTCSTNSIGTDSFFTVDWDYLSPSLSLLYLFNVRIDLPAGISCSDGTHTETLGSGAWVTALHSEDDIFPASDGGIDAIAPFSLTADPSFNLTIMYEWGDASCTDTDTAGYWSGSHSGTVSNPNWDYARAVVVTDASIKPVSILFTTRECLGSGNYADTVYTLTPL